MADEKFLCPYCKKLHPLDAQFCRVSGESISEKDKLPKKDAGLVCPICGEIHKLDAKYCSKTGHEIAVVAEGLISSPGIELDENGEEKYLRDDTAVVPVLIDDFADENPMDEISEEEVFAGKSEAPVKEEGETEAAEPEIDEDGEQEEGGEVERSEENQTDDVEQVGGKENPVGVVVIDGATQGNTSAMVRKYCTKCGRVVDDDWKTCAYCGENLSSNRPAWLVWAVIALGALLVVFAIWGGVKLLTNSELSFFDGMSKEEKATQTAMAMHTATQTATQTPRPTATITPTATPTPLILPDFVAPLEEKAYTQLCVASYFQAKGELNYACQMNSGAWRDETVDSGGAGLYPSLAFDENDMAYLGYYDEANGDLKFGVRNDTSWTLEVVDADGDVGKFPALVVDGAGRVLVSYYDQTRGMIKFAFREGTNWHSLDIDEVGKYDGFESIGMALDQAGRPWISYYDRDAEMLKAAFFDNGVWEILVVDSNGNVGKHSSLAIDQDGWPGISYFNDSQKRLQYTQFNGQDWDIEIVDAKGEVGIFTSLAYGSDNQPRISYFDDDRDDVKFAVRKGTSWSVQTVDTYRNVGFYTDMVLNKDVPYIAYYYYAGQTMRIANLYNGSWNIRPGTTAAESGLYPSLAYKFTH